MSTRKILYMFSLLFIILGVVMEPSTTLFTNLSNIVVGKDGLITDYFIKGSIGSAFLNAGLSGLITTLLLDKVKSSFNGITFASVMLVIGFALFGKNIINIWPIIVGSILYGKTSNKPLKNVLPIAFFATSLSPLISEVIFVFEGNVFIKVILGILLGIFIGYIVQLVAPHVRAIHQGFNLYNVGFAIGIIGTIMVSIMRSLGYIVESQLVWDTNKHTKLYIIFLSVFIVILIYGLIKDQGFSSYKQLLKTTGFGADYFKEFTVNTVLINIGALGIFTLILLYVLNIPLNGPMLGGVITIVGFGGSGKHLRNITPIFIGVLLGSLSSTWNITDPSVALTMMFLTGLAPVAGTYGLVAGIIAAYINTSVALNTGVLHGGLNLYNTGFSIGITCAFIIPIYKHIFKTKNIQ